MSGRLNFFAILGAAMAPVLAGCGLANMLEVKAGPLVVETQEIHLNPEKPNQTNLGVLSFRGGLEITSRGVDLGGLSGLSLTKDGTGIISVTDQGDLFRATLRHDRKGRLVGLDDGRLHRLRDVDGNHLSQRPDKRDQDTEAIERLSDGSYLVSFEVRHRILRYKTLRGKPTPFSLPPGMEDAPRNGGLEAITPLPDGRILLMTEKLRTDGKGKGDYVGWLLDREGKSLGKIYWPGFGLFRPSDLAALPNGDVLLLQRRYTVSGGAAMRLSQIPSRQIKPGSRMLDVELALLAPPLTVDGFEGLAIHPDPTGGWQVYMLSDDNFNPLQRTLLLQFHMPN